MERKARGKISSRRPAILGLDMENNVRYPVPVPEREIKLPHANKEMAVQPRHHQMH